VNLDGGYACTCPVGTYGNGYNSASITLTSSLSNAWGSGYDLSSTMGCTNIDECSCTSGSTTDACGYLTYASGYASTPVRQLSYHDCASGLNSYPPYNMVTFGTSTNAASTTAHCTDKNYDDATANDRKWVCTCPAGYSGSGSAAQGTGNSCSTVNECSGTHFCDTNANCVE
jgi:hypothetical protein